MPGLGQEVSFLVPKWPIVSAPLVGFSLLQTTYLYLHSLAF
jgi:hypothetical protein